jgi:hypothetical protein
LASWRDLGGPALAIGTAVTRAVDAAAARDREGYETAAVDLSALPAEQTGLLLAALVRSLLEEGHPDGLDGDDIQAVLDGCVRGAAAWLAPDRVRPRTVVAVLASALGIHEAGLTYAEPARPHGPDDWPWEEEVAKPPTPAEFAWHAPLVVTDLLGGRPLRRHLDAAFTEIARAEAMDL